MISKYAKTRKTLLDFAFFVGCYRFALFESGKGKR